MSESDHMISRDPNELDLFDFPSIFNSEEMVELDSAADSGGETSTNMHWENVAPLTLEIPFWMINQYGYLEAMSGSKQLPFGGGLNRDFQIADMDVGTAWIDEKEKKLEEAITLLRSQQNSNDNLDWLLWETDNSVSAGETPDERGDTPFELVTDDAFDFDNLTVFAGEHLDNEYL